MPHVSLLEMCIQSWSIQTFKWNQVEAMNLRSHECCASYFHSESMNAPTRIDRISSWTLNNNNNLRFLYFYIAIIIIAISIKKWSDHNSLNQGKEERARGWNTQTDRQIVGAREMAGKMQLFSIRMLVISKWHWSISTSQHGA